MPTDIQELIAHFVSQAQRRGSIMLDEGTFIAIVKSNQQELENAMLVVHQMTVKPPVDAKVIQALTVIKDMVSRKSRTRGEYSDKQLSYARDLIVKHLAPHIIAAVNGVEAPVSFAEQKAEAAAAEAKDAYADNSQWGMF